MITASINNSLDKHQVLLTTGNNAKKLHVAPKENGYGSSVNGAEFLLTGVATCFCNDIYREAVKRGISVSSVSVRAEADFDTEDGTATQVTYHAEVVADASAEVIHELISYVDAIAEVHNTLRKGIPVTYVA